MFLNLNAAVMLVVTSYIFLQADTIESVWEQISNLIFSIPCFVKHKITIISIQHTQVLLFIAFFILKLIIDMNVLENDDMNKE